MEVEKMLKEYREGDFKSPTEYIRKCRNYIDLDLFESFLNELYKYGKNKSKKK